MSKIWFTGDTHAGFHKLMPEDNPVLEELGPEDFLIVCGDFGIWDGSAREVFAFDEIAKNPFTTLFVDGNHENFDMLYAMPVEEWNGGKVHRIRDNIFHLMRGQVFEIGGKKLFTMGGASSHDISDGILEKDDPAFRQKITKLSITGRNQWRVNHVSWWAQEMPSKDEYAEALENLEKHGFEVDYVATHCCPSEIQDIFSDGVYQHDELTDWFDALDKKLSFKHWFFGHYHAEHDIGTRYHMLYHDILDAIELDTPEGS